MDLKLINANIAYYKKLHRYTDKDIATMIGVTEPTLRKRLQTPEMFTVQEIARLASVFKVDITKMFETR